MRKPFKTAHGLRHDLRYHSFIDGTCVWCRYDRNDSTCGECGNPMHEHPCAGGQRREGRLPCPPMRDDFAPDPNRPRWPSPPYDLMGM